MYIAPGPSYVAATNASPEFPFSGLAFSYIVPGGSGCPIPSVAAHDVAAVDDGDETRWHRGKPGERKYVLVLNAVDAIHVLEVRDKCFWCNDSLDFYFCPVYSRMMCAGGCDVDLGTYRQL